MADDDEVWVQLYIEGKGKKGNVFTVQRQRDLYDLAERVYEERPKSLWHCKATDLVFYMPGTEFPTNKKDKLSVDMPVPLRITGPNPLRVVAPAALR